jgi:prepilin-type N-terminal cleavage/methylation domain-containing protein
MDLRKDFARIRARRFRARQHGLSLIEVLIVLGIALLIMAMTHFTLRAVVGSWWRINGNQDSEHHLYRGRSALKRDLDEAAFELQPDRATIAVEKAPSVLTSLAGSDGDVLWMLSAVDPVSGEFQRKDNGSPFWQRNVVYYAVCPDPGGLEAMGFTGSGLSVAGYEAACPHKVLIRLEIDSGPATTPGSDPSSTEETLLSFADLSGYLSRPAGLDCAAMNRTGVQAKPIAARVVTFRAELFPDTRGVQVDLRCSSFERARQEGPVGARDLLADPSTTGCMFVAFPPNHTSPTPP